MPHDVNGKLLQVGDEVVIRGKVTYVGPADDGFCNCTVEFKYPMPGYPDSKQSLSALNTKMVEKVEEVINHDA